MTKPWCTALLIALVAVGTLPLIAQSKSTDVSTWEWTEINASADWSPRAGLQALALEGSLYVLGGRTPRPFMFPPLPGDSDLWGDVWRSDDRGRSWQRILDSGTPGSWPARAYFQSLVVGEQMVVLGGQNFIAGDDCPMGVPVCSDFFNDVWKSDDGVHWIEVTDNAGWDPRAGLSSVLYRGEVYVMGGSFLDEEIIGGDNRVLFDDVWKSADGVHWEQVVEHAPWDARAGSVAVVKDDWIYLLGGEDGFVCAPLPCAPPYFNDVWRTQDGANWELVTASAGWSPRPGHQCVVVLDQFICFGGFGLSQDPENPFEPSNPVDVWASEDGAHWEKVSDSPWNATTPDEIKYDFKAIPIRAARSSGLRGVLTFGGDRETFDFLDPKNYLNVDNDVWLFAPTADQ